MLHLHKLLRGKLIGNPLKAVLDGVGHHDDCLGEGIACPVVPLVHFKQAVHRSQLFLQFTPCLHATLAVCALRR